MPGVGLELDAPRQAHTVCRRSLEVVAFPAWHEAYLAEHSYVSPDWQFWQLWRLTVEEPLAERELRNGFASASAIMKTNARQNEKQNAKL